MKLLVLTLCAVVAASATAASRRLIPLAETTPFAPGFEYTFRYTTQIASGIQFQQSGINKNEQSKPQQATYQASALAVIHFQTERIATLALKDIIVTAQNGAPLDPRQISSLNFGEEKTLETEIQKQLEYVVKFDYVNGLVEKIYFHNKDTAWSKNIKRAILNMIQLNLSRRTTDVQSLNYANDGVKNMQSANMFVLPEVSLEGECQTMYTLSMPDANQLFNVTKSIDFKQCNTISKTQYGPRIQKPCSECRQQEIDQQQLDRNSVFQLELVGTPEKYAIRRVNVLSQYIYKVLAAESAQPLQTVVASELILTNVEKKTQSMSVAVYHKEESILYSLEWDQLERRFYQYGDIEFTQESTPFATINNKVSMIMLLLKHISAATADKTTGIETEASLRLQKLVEYIRMCTVVEMKQVTEQINTLESQTEQLKLQEIWINALGIAGTRNAVNQLVHGILNNEISTQKAVESLKQLTSVVAPSDSIVENLLQLCKSEVAQRNLPVQQTCWLTVSALIGDLCQDLGNDAQNEQQCSRTKKQELVKILMKQFDSAETTYQKVLALKTIGNAALDISVFDLEKIIVNVAEEPIVRQQAIDALRRLRNQLPRKIQTILMPVFKNVRETPVVRMTAFTMIMFTNPENVVIDQIAYVLFKEQSRQIKSFVYSALNAYASSPVSSEKRLAKHLQTVLRMTSDTKTSSSNFARVPLYSETHSEGVFVNLASIFSTNNMLPNHVSVSIDSVLNNLLEKNAFSLNLSQQDIERYYQQLVDALYSHGSGNSRAHRVSNNKKAEDELDLIFDNLRIESRGADARNAFGMMTIRVRDVDTVILPLSDEFLPSYLQKMLRGEKISLSSLDLKLLKGQHFHSHSVGMLHERVVKVATSSGLPLNIVHSVPTVASIDGQIKALLEEDRVKLTIKTQPMLNLIHIISMQIWSPIVATGVETMHSLDLNLPLNADFQVTFGSSNENVKLTLRLPEKTTRMISVNSLPLTFVRNYNTKSKMLNEPEVKAIRNNLLESRLIELNISERLAEKTGLRVNGHVHQLPTWTYTDLVALCSTTENHVVVEFVPTSQSPKEIELTASADFFSRVSKDDVFPLSKIFFAKNDESFDTKYEAELNDEDNFEKEQTSVNTFLDESDYKSRQMYSHFIKVSLKTKGAERNVEAKTEVKSVCDNKSTFCQMEMLIQRSALFEHETSDWSLNSKMQLVLPQYVRSISQLDENRKNKLACKIDAEWGFDADKLQKLVFQVNGERVVAEKKLSARRNLAAAFLNRFSLTAKYQLSAVTESRFAQLLEMFKLYNFWNTESTQKVSKNNALFATIVIDPLTRQYANLSIITPQQSVRMSNIRFWMPVKPFALVRPTTSEINNVVDVFERVSETNRDECRVDGAKVKTFDDVFYKAPITSCYSVIATDCARKSFAVLVKALSQNSDKKQLKLITKKAVIEIKPRLNSDKLIVRINNDEVTDEQILAENYVNIVNADMNVRIKLPQGVLVNFDGEEALVKLSGMYKNAQCGLCGHYDGEDNNEWRMSDNSVTTDLKAFHRSFSLINEDAECEQKYDQDSLFSTMENTIDSEYDSAYDTEDERDALEYQHFDADSEETDSDSDDSSNISPEIKTQVVEYNHKICFSTKPVKQCPRGSYAVKSEQKKISFTCMKRSSNQAHRLLRAARNQDISVELSNNKPSFVEPVKAALSCERY